MRKENRSFHFRFRKHSRNVNCADALQLGFWQTSYKLEVSKVPILDSITLLELLTELRETYYLLDYWVIIKGAARWKRHIGQVIRRVQELPCPPREHIRSPCIHYQEVLWTLVWGFMEAPVCKHDGWLDHWPLVTELHLQPLSFPGRSRGWDHPSNHRAGFTGYQPPSLVNQEVFQNPLY